MTLDSLKINDLLTLDIFWKLKVKVNGYQDYIGSELVTQASAGRCFKVIRDNSYENEIVQSS